MQRLSDTASPVRLLLLKSLRRLVLLLFEILDCILKEVHLLLVFRVEPLLDDPVARLVPLQVETDRVLEGHWVLFFVWVALHQLVDLDALEWSHLAYVVFQGRESATHSDHDLVRLDHQDASLGAYHVFTLVGLRSFLKFNDRQEGYKHNLKLDFTHDSQVL